VPRQRPTLGPGAAAAAVWLGVVVVIAALRGATGWPAPASLACSADALAAGKLWLLPASALVVQGPAPALQIAGTALLAWVVVHRFGAATFWGVAIAAHVGSTLLSYAGVGAVWLVDRHAASPVVDVADYGISAIWAGCVGAIAVAGALGALPRPRLALAVGTACLLTFVVLVPANGELSDWEHLVAFVAGAAVAFWSLHHAGDAHVDALRPPRVPSLRRRAGAVAGLAGGAGLRARRARHRGRRRAASPLSGADPGGRAGR
jgi:hypothetical protein